MLASTWARKVVGIWTTGMPRMKIGGEKTRTVAHHASAKGHDHGFTVSAGINHLLGKLFHAREPLGRLAIIHLQDLIRDLGLAQREFQRLAPVLAYRWRK